MFNVINSMYKVLIEMRAADYNLMLLLLWCNSSYTMVFSPFQNNDNVI